MPPVVQRLYPTYRCFWWFRHQRWQWQRQGRWGKQWRWRWISFEKVQNGQELINLCAKWILHIVGHVLRWVILHLNLNRNNKVHREFCLKSNLKTISALAVFAFHLVGNNTWIIFLVEGGRRMVKIFGNFIKTTFAPLASAFDPICFWYHLDYLSSIQYCCIVTNEWKTAITLESIEGFTSWHWHWYG